MKLSGTSIAFLTSNDLRCLVNAADLFTTVEIFTKTDAELKSALVGSIASGNSPLLDMDYTSPLVHELILPERFGYVKYLTSKVNKGESDLVDFATFIGSNPMAMAPVARVAPVARPATAAPVAQPAKAAAPVAAPAAAAKPAGAPIARPAAVGLARPAAVGAKSTAAVPAGAKVEEPAAAAAAPAQRDVGELFAQLLGKLDELSLELGKLGAKVAEMQAEAQENAEKVGELAATVESINANTAFVALSTYNGILIGFGYDDAAERGANMADQFPATLDEFNGMFNAPAAEADPAG